MIEASCHCGAVRISLARAPDELTECNCSICRRLGALWAYYDPWEVTVCAAEDDIAGYVRESRLLRFCHCRHCGCPTHWEGFHPEVRRVGINARLLEPEVVDEAHIRRIDGAYDYEDLDAPFIPPPS